MASIEEQIQPWTEEQKTIGRELHEILQPRLRDILLRGYSTLDPTIESISDEVYNDELEKFYFIIRGELTAAYFDKQGSIAQAVAKTVTYPQYLCPGYATYSYELVAALLDATRWKTKRQRNNLIRSLLRSIFVEVSVAMHHFFAEITEVADAQRLEFDRQREAAAKDDRDAVATFAAALAALASGDLSFRIRGDGLANSETIANYNEASTALTEAMQTIRATSTDITLATQSIADATGNLSSRTEQQAASLEQTASALEEFAEAVRRTSESARIANTMTTDARSNAERSRQVMSQAIDAMTDIEMSSNEINKIVGVIDEIAFQTNLLALNAGVEAARAGEAGKGFAVVASEVRALAQRSAEAAKQIRSLVNSSEVQVKRGVGLVNTTGQTLTAIVNKVAEVDDLITSIAASASEQASSVREINEAITQMDNATQRNAAMVEDTSGATANLRMKAEHLADLVARFKLTKDSNSERPGNITRAA